jgi:phosphoglycerate dehydrogenase-like enzyme
VILGLKILIHEPEPGANEMKQLLQKQGFTDIITQWGEESFSSSMNGVEILLTEFAPESVIKAGEPTLKFIQCIYRGVDGIDLKAAKKGDVMVSHTGSNIISTAEHTLALILAVAKKILPSDQALRQGDWDYSYYGTEYSTLLHGKTLAVIGLGAIGQEVGVRAKAFGMRVIGIRRSGKSLSFAEVFKPDQLHDVLRQADIIVVTTSLTPETTSLFGAKEFEQMKPNALFINTSRGLVVDPDSLYRALKDKRIAGAGIDVWYNYPAFGSHGERVLPADQPFHTLDNVVMTPHRAGFVVEAKNAYYKEAVENVIRFMKGEPAHDPIDLDKGY